jgi:DivIVA domain-containing protein
VSTDIDVPFLPSAAQIRRREFASVRRGYDPDQVRGYLAQIAEQIEILEQEVRELRLQPGPTEGPPSGRPPSEDPYERLANRLTTLLATADHEAEGILAEARAEATAMVNEARTEADRIRVDAQARAEEARQQGNEFLEKAKAEADRVLVGLSARRQDMVQQLQDMQTRLLGVAKDLEVAIDDPISEADDHGPTPEAPTRAQVPAAEVAEARSTERTSAEVHNAGSTGKQEDDPVDSLEGMLSDEDMDLPEIPPLELDFDEDDQA